MPLLSAIPRLVPLALLCAAAGAAQAAPGQPGYLQEREACAAIAAPESRAACMREAGAARQAARAGQLSSSDASVYERNAIARCSAFRNPGDQADCVGRVKSDTASGSVMGGGILREAESPVAPQ